MLAEQYMTLFSDHDSNFHDGTALMRLCRERYEKFIDPEQVSGYGRV